MKKLIWVALSMLLGACSTPTQQSSVPLDMKTVQEYQQRVASGKTVVKAEPWELNQSDKRPKVVVVTPAYHTHYSPFRARVLPTHYRYAMTNMEMY